MAKGSLAQIIMEYFLARQERRKQYSLRAFARDLDLKPSQIYDLVSGRRGISVATAVKIAERLQLSAIETNQLKDLAESMHGRSAAARTNAKLRMKTDDSDVVLHDLLPKELILMAEWYYPAILEMVDLKPKRSAAQIARSFGITTAQVEDCLRLLVKNKFLKKTDSRYVRQRPHLKAASKVPKKIIRDFHKQISSLNIDRIDRTPILSRKNLSTVLAFDSNRIDEARTFIEKMQTEFIERFQPAGGENCVYTFSQAFFRLDGLDDE